MVSDNVTNKVEAWDLLSPTTVENPALLAVALLMEPPTANSDVVPAEVAAILVITLV